MRKNIYKFALSLLGKWRRFIVRKIVKLGIGLGRSVGYDQLKKDLEIIKKMDFLDRQLLMKVDSDIEHGSRVNACAKEPFTVDWIRKIACKGVFYDVGANVGSYSLIAASLMSGSNKVVAFEPAYFNFYKLNENIRINNFNNRIIPLNIALTDKNVVEQMFFSRIDDGASLHMLGKKTKSFTHSIPVLCMTFDEVIKRYSIPFPNHIKIDVDGYELVVLTGGKKTFRHPQVKSVMIEVNEANKKQASRINEFLLMSGLKLYKKYKLITEGLYNELFLR